MTVSQNVKVPSAYHTKPISQVRNKDAEIMQVQTHALTGMEACLKIFAINLQRGHLLRSAGSFIFFYKNSAAPSYDLRCA